MEAILGEILVVPFFGQGHLFPSMELCKKFSSFNYKSTLLIPSHLSFSVPADLRRHFFIEVVEIPAREMNIPPPEAAAEMGQSRNPMRQPHQQIMRGGIEDFLAERYGGPGTTRPDCVVVDVMMSWSSEMFAKLGIPTVSFLTSGACSAAMEFAAWKNKVDETKPGQTRFLPGLPEHMALTHSEIQRPHRRGPPPHLHRGNGVPINGPPGPGIPSGPRGPGFPPGPRGPGSRPHWLDGVESSIAVLINTCDDLERPFIEYLSNQIQKPIWGVGPSLPAQFWESAGSILRDHVVRSSNRSSNLTEEEVVTWLNSKPRQSVIYVSFGSEVAPTMEESEELANALEESNRPFIWVIQPGSGKPGPPTGLFGKKSPGSDSANEGYYPNGLQERIGDRGLIIKGWAPQLLILSHPSTGGFLSHCGWNSTLESIGRGVPILAWPIRGDQFFDAKLIGNHLKVGHLLASNKDATEAMKKDEIASGIEKLMNDEEVHSRAVALKSKFEAGFPQSSTISFNSFIKLIGK